MSPTITSPAMTQRGVILGTAAYMSPEQARGKPVDKRSDIWAFGVVLLEMFTGKAVFAGETVTDVLAAVVTREPDLGVLPAATPPRVRELLRRCLQKDSKQRLRDVGDARIALQEAQGELGAAARPDTPAASRRRERVFGVVALLSVLTTIRSVAAIRFRSCTGAGHRPPRRVPFGSTSAFMSGGSRFRLMAATWRSRRSFPHAESMCGPSTPPAYVSCLALNSRRARRRFSSGLRTVDTSRTSLRGRLKKVPATGGPAEVICTLPPAMNYTGTWSERGVILFGAATREGTTIWRVPAAGGQPVPLHDANASKPEQAFFPIFLPDGRHYLAMVPTGNGQTAEAFVGELDSTDRRRLPGVTSSPRYSSAGYLLFARAGSLVAQPFDLGDLELSGEPRLIVENLGDSVGGFSASATGALAYRAHAR